ncbi:MAG: hypothetical protein C3F07_11870 [Anaerolineales bacterium]|nr:hypothetical protein [Anaerolineae bacterium]PWB72480.1 MAG: hypothetical protein C3F07_11870 [Anaerolineales bacterium]
MIDALVRRFLGTVGSSLLDFYIQNNLWINAILFTYAILVVFARRNYFQIARLILADFIHEYGDKLTEKSPKQVRTLLVKWKIPWENGMQAGWFPFISSPQSILLRLKSDRTFQKIFSIDALVEIAVQQTSSRSK